MYILSCEIITTELHTTGNQEAFPENVTSHALTRASGRKVPGYARGEPALHAARRIRLIVGGSFFPGALDDRIRARRHNPAAWLPRARWCHWRARPWPPAPPCRNRCAGPAR